MAWPTDLPDQTADNLINDGSTIVKAADINTNNVIIDGIAAKVGADASAVTMSHDYMLSNIVKAPASTAFNATLTAANTFQDLDLSATVGAGTAIVFLGITGNAAVKQFAVKTKGVGGGFTAHIHNTQGYDYGCCTMHIQTAGDYAHMCLPTDSAGKVEIGANDNTTTWTVTLLAYIANN